MPKLLERRASNKRLKGPYATNEAFRKIATKTSHFVGSPWAFAGAVGVVLVWAITGPVFAFSDTWQLVINTGTTIVTFLMVFLIQNTQNRDSHALHLKIDELIRANGDARDQLIDLESLSDDELEALQTEFDRIARERQSCREMIRQRQNGGSSPPRTSSRSTGPRSSRATSAAPVPER